MPYKVVYCFRSTDAYYLVRASPQTDASLQLVVHDIGHELTSLYYRSMQFAFSGMWYTYIFLVSFL